MSPRRPPTNKLHFNRTAAAKALVRQARTTGSKKYVVRKTIKVNGQSVTTTSINRKKALADADKLRKKAATQKGKHQKKQAEMRTKKAKEAQKEAAANYRNSVKEQRVKHVQRLAAIASVKGKVSRATGTLSAATRLGTYRFNQ
jgi:hypothetical protein